MIERHPITSREEWLRMRMLDVTCSELAPVMGLDPDRTCASVWAEKVGLIEPTPQSDFFQYRECQEGANLRWIRRYGRPRWTLIEAETYWRDPDIRLGGTPDAAAIDYDREGVGIAELKTVRADIFERDWLQPDDTIVLPLGYQIQTVGQAMLTGASWAVVVTQVMGYGTGKFFVTEVELNPDIMARIRDVVVRFWADTTAGKVPRFDFDLDADVIEAMHRKVLVKEPPLDLGSDNLLPQLLDKRARRKDYIKHAEKWVERADAEIKSKIGGHESATLPGWKISWKLQQRAQRIVEASQYRVLRVTAAKDKPNG